MKWNCRIHWKWLDKKRAEKTEDAFIAENGIYVQSRCSPSYLCRDPPKLNYSHSEVYGVYENPKGDNLIIYKDGCVEVTKGWPSNLGQGYLEMLSDMGETVKDCFV